MDEIESLNNKSTGKGGARPGAGRKRGKMEKATIRRMKVLEAVKKRIEGQAQRLIDAQISTALGNSYLYCKIKHKDGSKIWHEVVQIENPETIREYLDGKFENDPNADEYYYIVTERPDSRAIDSLLDRTFGKSTTVVALEPGSEPITGITVTYIENESKHTSDERAEEDNRSSEEIQDSMQ